MVDEMMYEMIDINIGEYETQARPCAWDDINAPTRVTEYHTTCQDCGQRVVIAEGLENSFKTIDGISVTYCTECGSGKKVYDSLPSNTQESVIIDNTVVNAAQDFPDLVLEYSFENVFQLREVDAYMTSILNGVEIVDKESVVESVRDLVDDAVESLENDELNDEMPDDDLQSLLDDLGE